MRYKDFIGVVSKETSLPVAAVDRVLRTMSDLIVSGTLSGDEISFPSLGKFKLSRSYTKKDNETGVVRSYLSIKFVCHKKLRKVITNAVTKE